MVKYATALRLGTADIEALPREAIARDKRD
jgi:hypothetical protein